MTRPKTNREEAFVLFALGLPCEQIAKKLSANPKTIYRWRDKYGWIERSEALSQKLSEDMQENVLLIKRRQLKIMQDIQKLGFDLLLTGKLKLTADTLLAAMRWEWSLVGGTAEHTAEIKDSALERAVREAFKPNEQSLSARDISEIYEEMKKKRNAKTEDAEKKN